MLSPELLKHLGELTDLGAAGSLLSWDQMVMMPEGGGPARGDVMATLATVGHERQTSAELSRLLDGAQPEDEQDEALLRVARKDFERASQVPVELAAAIEKAAADAQEPWASARAQDDFARFAPFLERNLDLRRQYAACFSDGFRHPYDALLDVFEPGLTTERVRSLFGQLREGLVPLVARLAGAADQPPELPGPWDVAAQRTFALEVARKMGFSEDAWRLDDAVHPFAQSVSGRDVRVTSRYAADDLQGLFCVLHEMGHGLYEHQVDPALARTTAGTGVSLGIHESQSRLWENCVGRSEPFWRFWLPRARELFPVNLKGVSDHDVLRSMNVVRPSLIRTDADEVTYCLHVVLRFELEVAMLEGSLEVADLPRRWDAGMQELLGVEVPNDTLGVLQDVHWSFGELGYFPTYAIGTMAAAQFWDAARRDLPALDDDLAAGEYGALRAWLEEHVHRHGRLVEPADVLRRATGQELDPAVLLGQLEAKFLPLYGLS